MSLVASIGIGAAAYTMMKPKNAVRQTIARQMNKMNRHGEEASLNN